ncbi:OprD family porin [Pseudomonas sp. 2FE]|uniref:OprD family porin n=1 Tax=Pseudomonas sp. 2FE TaxID=2502190 RepID=UPI0010F9F6DC|nr:OprD family porin [Pseudomonas sp. 2FE]
MHVMKYSALALAILAGSPLAQASEQSEGQGLIDDSHLNLLNRNLYYNDDNRASGAEQSKAEEWAQGVLATFESGFSQGRVGFGVDAHGMFGIKLDSGRGRAGSGLLPEDGGHCNAEGLCGSQDSYGEAGGALKARLSDTTLKVGEMFVHTPVYDTGDTRLLPETSTGILLTSKEIADLELTAGHFTAANRQNSTNSDDVFFGYGENVASDGAMDFLGATYSFSDATSASLFASELEDYWRQYYVNLSHGIELADERSLALNFNLYRTNDYGQAKAGDIGNTFWSLAGTYTLGAHGFTLAYQQVDGDTPFDYVTNWGIYVANSYYSDFNGPNEKSWKLQYDLDMGGLVTPGLSAFAVYLKGFDIDGRQIDADSAYFADWGGMDDEKHHELDLGLKYVVPQGPAKDLSFYLVQQVNRGTSGQFDGDQDRLRLYVEYPLEIF